MEKHENQLGCKRCGICCHYVAYNEQGIPRLKKCKHLVKLKSGKTICREYKKAIQERTKHGHKIDEFVLNGEKKVIFCTWREGGHFNYKGCPFNKEGMPMFEDYLDNVGVKYKW